MTAVLKTPIRKPFGGYSIYVSSLKRLAQESRSVPDWNSRVDAALNGQAGVELRRVASVETRRKFGAFFTGTDLSSKLIAHSTSIDTASIFYDPTCGMGDLLVATARKLPLRKSLPETLRQWGRQLSGTDLHSEFVEGARTRLLLLARQRHKSDEPLHSSNAGFFPNIRVADGLKQYALFDRATHLLLNPPFRQAPAPLGCKWAGGRITEAATFVIAALERIKSGTEVFAILPEVLRSGSFSEQWRKRINELAKVRLVQPYGIFDDSVDIDVFLLHLVRQDALSIAYTQKWFKPTAMSTATIADFFDVHVGCVVPHRDAEVGEEHPYIHARCVPTWTVMRVFQEFRRHKGLAYTPPFVVIRRTSRPGHPYRAAATVIVGKRPVAVENHLIVCEPKDGKFETCQKLMMQLRTSTVNEFLNGRICCRHLTVGAVKEIPW
jgi:hypothetical protein